MLKASHYFGVIAVPLLLGGCPGSASEDSGGGSSSGIDPTAPTNGATDSADATGVMTFAGSGNNGSQSATEGDSSASADGSGTGASGPTSGPTSGPSGGTSAGSGTGDGGGTFGDGSGTAGGGCQVTMCLDKLYQCGDCMDNDGDEDIDVADIDCWGPCDNNESGWSGGIPGQDNSPCKHDCYWDYNSGSGNDDCYWSHKCDPLEPSLPKCQYKPGASVPGTTKSCAELEVEQTPECLDYCAPLSPNGCDCFGCCEVETSMGTETVFVGTEDSDGNGTCNSTTVEDPELCERCTPVASCLNPCEPQNCELCFGQTELPKNCEEAGCDPGVESCEVNADCPQFHFCLTGCCVPQPG